MEKILFSGERWGEGRNYFCSYPNPQPFFQRRLISLIKFYGGRRVLKSALPPLKRKLFNPERGWG
jgi:hypothetical protein